jgi:hypothetical protein
VSSDVQKLVLFCFSFAILGMDPKALCMLACSLILSYISSNKRLLFLGTQDRTKSLAHARQSAVPHEFYFELGLTNFAQAGLKLMIFLLLLST